MQLLRALQPPGSSLAAAPTHLSRGGLPHPHGGLEPRLPQLAPHKALWVVGGQGLLVAGLHDANLLPCLVGEEVGAAQALGGSLGLLQGGAGRGGAAGGARAET